jgi:hypothetical protein
MASATGALSGAGTGAAIGSAIPGIGTAIGAGVGGLIGLFGGKSKPSVSTTTMDAGSGGYLQRLQQMSDFMAGRQMPGLDPNVMAAIMAMQGYQHAGQQGLAAVTGDQNALQGFTNPGAQAMQAIFDLQRRQAFARTNAALTAPGGGAFAGNNRVGLAQGAAIGNVDTNQAQFGYQNFQDAINRAMDLAHGIPGASSWLSNQGYQLTNRQRDWDIGSQGLMRGGWLGPISTTTTGQPGQQGSNPWQSAVGGAMIGSSFGGGGHGTPSTPSETYQGPSEWWRNFMGNG